MALPNLANQRPTYSLTIPTTKEKINYHPYSKNQEKLILIASQEDNETVKINTLQEIIHDCTGKYFDNIVDFSFVATHIKSKSHGKSETIVLKECENKECDNTNIKINIDEITNCIVINNPDNLKSTYKVNNDLSLRLCPTKFDLLKNIKFDKTADVIYDQLYSIICYSVDYVVYKDKIEKDFSIDELKENIIQHLTSKQIEEINKEIGKLINIKFVVKYTCNKCEEEHSVEISDFLL